MKHRFMGLTLAALILSGCDQGTQAPESAAKPQTPALTQAQLKQRSLATRSVWYLAEPIIAEARDRAEQLLKEGVEPLLQAPAPDSLAKAQALWQAAAINFAPMNYYQELAELAPSHLARLRQMHYAIAAEPIEPGYLDSVGPYPYSGMVHDLSLPLTTETLRRQHGMTQAQDVALGLYALEFLLFGLPAAEPRQAEDFAAQPALTQAEQEHGYAAPEELPQNRRRQLLRLQAELLLQDLTRLSQLWAAPTPDSFYQEFADIPVAQRYRLLVIGVAQEVAELLESVAPSRASESATMDEASAEAGTDTETEAVATPLPEQTPDKVQSGTRVKRIAAELTHLARVLEVLDLDPELADMAESTAASLTQWSQDDSAQDTAVAKLQQLNAALAAPE